MDVGEKGNDYTDKTKKEVLSAILERCKRKREEANRIRKEKGFAEDSCVFCGGEIEEERRKIYLPDCERCRRERSQSSPPAQKAAVC